VRCENEPKLPRHQERRLLRADELKSPVRAEEKSGNSA
jgi:hypothetical protein